MRRCAALLRFAENLNSEAVSWYHCELCVSLERHPNRQKNRFENKGEQVVLVSEETESSNDNKLFKKIPAICKELEIETMTLPELIAKYEGIDIDFQ